MSHTSLLDGGVSTDQVMAELVVNTLRKLRQEFAEKTMLGQAAYLLEGQLPVAMGRQ
jgi:hypothetical protein